MTAAWVRDHVYDQSPSVFGYCTCGVPRTWHTRTQTERGAPKRKAKPQYPDRSTVLNVLAVALLDVPGWIPSTHGKGGEVASALAEKALRTIEGMV